VHDTLRRFRVTYNIIIGCILAVFLLFENDLRKSLQERNYTYFVPYSILIIVSYYFFFTCKNNPGYADTLPKNENQGIELQNSISQANRSGLSVSLRENNEQEHRESLLSSLTGLSSRKPSFPSPRNDSDDEEEKVNGSPRSRSERNIEPSRKTKRNNMPEQRFCEVCNIIQPYRTKHCHLCERCINKFDHHCIWIGGCVGELNHRRFYLFLILQSTVQIWTFIIANSGLNGIYEYNDQRVKELNNEGEGGEITTYESGEYVFFMIIAFILFVATLFTVLLLAFHTLLIVTNQTTWEFTRKDTLNYLRIYPKNFYPFSKGVIANLKMTFCHGNKIKEWELPLPPNAFGWDDERYSVSIQ